MLTNVMLEISPTVDVLGIVGDYDRGFDDGSFNGWSSSGDFGGDLCWVWSG